MRKLLEFLVYMRRDRNGRSDSVTMMDHRSRQELRRLVESARREWEAAEVYFQTVSDNELVDHAIFSVEAAHRKYLYLFRQLRRTESPSDNQEGAV